MYANVYSEINPHPTRVTPEDPGSLRHGALLPALGSHATNGRALTRIPLCLHGTRLGWSLRDRSSHHINHHIW